MAIERFVILNSPRVGSNLLCTLLDAHPEILCHHEIFNPHVIGVARSLKNTDFDLGTIEAREQNPLQVLQAVWDKKLGFSCVGFKMCWRQNETALNDILHDKSVRKIVLKRRDDLKSFVSLLLARKTTQWVVYDDENATIASEKVEVNKTEYKEFLEFNQGFYGEIETTLKATGQEALEVFFEDLFSIEERKRMLRFLNVDEDQAEKLYETTVRINPEKLEDLVGNYQEVKDLAQPAMP